MAWRNIKNIPESAAFFFDFFVSAFFDEDLFNLLLVATTFFFATFLGLAFEAILPRAFGRVDPL